MNRIEQFALKTTVHAFESEAKQAEKTGQRYYEEAEKEENAEEKQRLMQESFFSRGLSCGYGMSVNRLKELLEAAEQDIGGTQRR